MNKIKNVTVYCIDSYAHSKCGTYVCFVRTKAKNAADTKDVKITRSTAIRLENALKNQALKPNVLIRDNFVGLMYTIMEL